MKNFDLEERLINFSILIMEVVNSVQRSTNGVQLSKQLSRSGTSVTLHYGEAQGRNKEVVHWYTWTLLTRLTGLPAFGMAGRLNVEHLPKPYIGR